MPTPLPAALATALLARTEACWQQAERYFACAFPRAAIRLDVRGRAAGLAYLDRWALRFNPTLYAANQTEFLAHVVPHEVAHLIVHALYRGRVPRARPHGPEWQAVMRQVFDCTPARTHTFSVPKRTMHTVNYHCACQTHALGIRRHNRIVRGEARYLCKQCQQPLVAAR
ncbi:MAG: SprT family zinc-dependent metalloprotease [Aeromonas sp.]